MADETLALIRGALENTRTIALVGASAKPGRPSNQVMKYLLGHGYLVYPVNPGQAGKDIHRQLVHARLADVPGPLDMVDVFRAPAAVSDLIDEIIALKREKKIKTVWTQLGVIDETAAARARTAGLDVIMNRCPKIEIERLYGGESPHQIGSL
jgi:predicted CoA-binding protein